MPPYSILDIANSYDGSQQVKARELYRDVRSEAEAEALVFIENPPTLEERETVLDVARLLCATEALAYAYYFQHWQSIDDSATGFKELIAEFWPDFSTPQSMGFGSGSGGEPEDYKPTKPLGTFDNLIIMHSIRGKFPGFASWIDQARLLNLD
ncbi:hypothetical protein [Rhizobium leguminosarum]|uniref:hypothetical protein n=1 Tax=Rhizobium leguminosarum TaxID=384 RepID=UPI00143FAEA6|nr:hypothetical protein [Rhizobium leguminosarum]